MNLLDESSLFNIMNLVLIGVSSDNKRCSPIGWRWGGWLGSWVLCLRRVINSTFISLLKTLEFWISTQEIEAAISSFGNYIDGNVVQKPVNLLWFLSYLKCAEIFDLVPTNSHLFGYFEAEPKSFLAESRLKAEGINKNK